MFQIKSTYFFSQVIKNEMGPLALYKRNKKKLQKDTLMKSSLRTLFFFLTVFPIKDKN